MKKFYLPSNIQTTFGRRPENNIVISNAKTSGTHAMIAFDNGRFTLYDNASTNGTLVNGNKIERHVLKNGDRVLLGNVNFHYLDATLTFEDPENIVSYNSKAANQKQKRAKGSFSLQNIYATIKTTFQKLFKRKEITSSQQRSFKPAGIIAALVAVVLVLTIILTSVSPTKQALKEDFLPLNETPSLTEMALSNTFYYVPIDIPGEKAQRQEKYMTTLASDALDAADMLMDGYYDVRINIDTAYELLSDLMVECDIKSGTQYLKEKEVFAETNRLHANFEVAQVGYESYEVKDYGDILVNTDVISRKLLCAIAAGDNSAESFAILTYVAATVIEENRLNLDRQIQKKIKKLDNFFGSTKAYANIEKMAICTNVINRIATYADIAKAEVAQENIAYAKQIVPTMDNNIAAMKTSNVFTEDQKLALEYAAIASKEMINGAEYEINKYLEGAYVARNDSQYYVFDNVLITHASAAWGIFGTSEKVKDTVRSNSSKTKSKSWWDRAKSATGSMVSKAGDLAGSAVNGAIYIAKEGVNTVGYVVDQAGNVVYSGTLLMSMADTGMKPSDAYTLIGDEQDRQAKNFKEGKSGETFTTLKEAYDDVDMVIQFGMEELGEAVQDVVIDAVRNTTGVNLNFAKGYLPKTMSFLGSVATGTIGGLTSGIANVMSPKSTTTDVVKGLIDLAFSFWGGSSNLFKATPAGKAAVVQGGSIAKEAVKQGAIKTNKSVVSKLWDATKNLGKGFGKKLKNSASKVKKNMDNTFNENTSSHIFSGGGGKVIGNVAVATEKDAGQSFFGELAEHLLGSHFDNLAKDIIDDAFEEKEPNTITVYKEKTKDGIVEADDGQPINLSNILDPDIYDDGSFVGETKKALSNVNVNGVFDWLFGYDDADQAVDADTQETDDTLPQGEEPNEYPDVEAPQTVDGEQVDDQELEDWINQPDNDVEKPVNATYRWVLFDTDKSYVINSNEQLQNSETIFRRSNGNSYFYRKYYSHSESEPDDIMTQTFKWTRIRDSYYEGEDVSINISIIGKTDFDVAMKGGYSITSDLQPIRAEYQIDKSFDFSISNEEVTRTIRFKLPDVMDENEVLTIVDTNQQYYFFRPEAIK
jgi:hypothetical protein